MQRIPSGRARAVAVCLVAICALEAGLCLRYLLSIWISADGGPTWMPDAVWDFYDTFWDWEDLSRRALVFVTGAVFLRWWHRVAKNGIALAGDAPTYTIEGAMGAWFVPIVNLVLPYQLARQIEAASHGHHEPLLAQWWALNVARNIAWLVALRVAPGSSLETALVVYTGATSISCASAWLCHRVVGYFEQIQADAGVDAPTLAEVFR